jgi:hypothetical protein
MMAMAIILRILSMGITPTPIIKTTRIKDTTTTEEDMLITKVVNKAATDTMTNRELYHQLATELLLTCKQRLL